MNPLQQLWSHKQSVWLDFIRRSLLTSGELKKLIDKDGVRGMTSNPTIFEKAIAGGNEYDADLKRLALKKKSNEDIFLELAVRDIQMAADIFRPVFKSSGGTDGFVSLEVNPNLAHDTAGTIEEAKRLWKAVKRPNLMIKVPGTKEGVPAVEELTAAGLNINITLLFSVDSYKKVLDAYMRGLERRVKKGLPIGQIASVASFFVSRVDTIVDKTLDQKIADGNKNAHALLHKAAIANAKLAFAHYLGVTKSSRWAKLAAKKAQTQRLLWASTSTKDKRLRDVIYVEELIGPDTANTMPPATVDAFREHGVVAEKLGEGLREAEEVIPALENLGIDFNGSMQKLQNDGVKSFADSYESLLRVVGAKAELLTRALAARVKFDLGDQRDAFEMALRRMESEKWIERLWSRDATLWKNDPDHQKIIANSLGWLSVLSAVKRHQKRVREIAADVRQAKFSNILLLGMGGSSLCPEVLRLTFGKRAGYPDFAILDSTEPASVIERARRSKPEKTLYVVASKSGSTTEPNAFLAYFYEEVRRKKGPKAGENFIAITDPGTQMERIAIEKKFRHIVLNPSDIGGRYSALSFFGMLPAALMGAPMDDIIEGAGRMADACSALLPPPANPGAMLGAALGALAIEGRDKVTFSLSKDIASFSTWVEQLVAESTGKEGKGILPVESEPILGPEAYGNDRVFVSITTDRQKDAAARKKLEALRKAGHPVIWITMEDKSRIGAEMFRWEIATAVAGAFLDINPFDQPNVQESKDLTREYLDKFKQQGSISAGKPVVQGSGLAVYGRNGIGAAASVEEAVAALLGELKPGDYVALLAYIERNAEHESILAAIRKEILKARKVATTVGFGPRFLHSTGQLHKGGGDNGVFLQITADDKKDLPIPGERYTYSVLKEAQALGDLSALQNKNRRAIRIHLSDGKRGLAKLADIVRRAAARE